MQIECFNHGNFSVDIDSCFIKLSQTEVFDIFCNTCTYCVAKEEKLYHMWSNLEIPTRRHAVALYDMYEKL